MVKRKNNMYPLRYTVLSSNEIENEITESNYKRLEASFRGSDGQVKRNLIYNLKCEKVPLYNPTNGLIKKAVHPDRFARIFSKKGISLYSPSEIIFLKPKSPKTISKKTDVDFNILKLKKDTIVLTRSGTVGNCSFVSKTLEGKYFSDDLIRLGKIEKKHLGLVYFFMKSSFGKVLISTTKYGSVVEHLEPEHLMDIQVPILNDSVLKEMEAALREIHRKRDLANNLLENADTELKKLLNIPDVSKLKPKYYKKNGTRNFVVGNDDLNVRFDASYHIPLATEIMSKLQKTGFPLIPIGDPDVSDEIILPGRFKRWYVTKEFGKPFLGSKEILEYDLSDVKKYLSLKRHDDLIKILTMKENMILISASGTIGNVIIAPKYYDGWTASQHVIRIKASANVKSGYLYTFLASDFGKVLIQRQTYGTNTDELTDVQVGSILIPKIPKDKMNSIDKKVQEANKLRHEAFELEVKNIKKLEKILNG